MSDNPLADWLRDGGSWSADEPDADGPPSALGRAPAPGPAAAARQDADRGGPAPVEPGPPPGRAADVPEPATAAPFGDWDDDPAPPRPRSRRLLLLGLAVVPWLGFAAVALGALGGTDTTPEGTSGDASGSPATGSAPSSPGDPAGRADAERQAGAVASVALRTALTGEVAGADGTVRYVDLVMVESLDWVGDVAVVGVAAVVLESAGETWGEARAARFAVPVRVTGDGAAPVADPWPLGSAAEGDVPTWDPVADADLAAAAARALTDGGYDEIAEVTPHRSDDVPGVLAVDVVAVAPGSRDAAAHRVWVRDADPPSLLPAAPSP